MRKMFGDFSERLDSRTRQGLLLQIREGIMVVGFPKCIKLMMVVARRLPAKSQFFPPAKRTNSVFDPTVVDGHLTIAKIKDECGPAPQAVIDGFCR